MPKPSQTSELSALQERNELLELLSDVGVSLAGSFDIRAILQTTRDAAARLSRNEAVDILYVGCEAIHSRPMWHPLEPGRPRLSAAERDAVLGGGPDAEMPNVGSYRCFPISYQDELLGYLVVGPADADNPEADAERDRLLAILTLQAATALRNIHATQERILFERSSAIGRMIGSVVHDFRSPLTALRGYAGMLTNLKLDDGERAAYGRYVIEECDRLDHMVGEMLEFTRGGTVLLEPSSFRIGPFVEGLATRLRAHYGRKGIRVTVDVAGYGGDEIFADERRLNRAVWNIATNACQAMPDGGTVHIRAHRRDDSVELSVRDEGTGIPTEVRHRIFEPFFSYGKSEGIGLGMLIAKKAAEDHGGAIEVESEAGNGTTVRLKIPTTLSETAEPSAVGATKSGD